MKKIAAFLAVAVIAYSIYYDLTIGTLALDKAVTAVSEINVATELEQSDNMPYHTKTTKAGDTVISITEELHQGPLPVSIDQLIDDFQTLNKGLKPDEIQINKEYKFPLYRPREE
ncbi:Uncharacterised protein [Bacillus freudenreichii]|nr:Uncharacterised protein [Bacillus freudenreichii]